MRAGGAVVGVVFFAEAGEGVGDGGCFCVCCEVQDDKRLALAVEENGAFPTIVDIGLEGDDPRMGLGFIPGKDDFAAVPDS